MVTNTMVRDFLIVIPRFPKTTNNLKVRVTMKSQVRLVGAMFLAHRLSRVRMKSVLILVAGLTTCCEKSTAFQPH
jgi:hypothetical protein